MLAFCGFDLETTGKVAGQDETIQVGAHLVLSRVCPDSGRALDVDVDARTWPPADAVSYCSLVHSKRELPVKVRRMTGISAESVQSARSFGEVALEFLAWLQTERRGARVCIVTYNGLGFDFLIFGRQLAAASFNVQQYFAEVAVVAHCDMQPVMKANAFRVFTLGSVYQQVFGESFDNAHTGDADACATLRLFFAFKTDLRTGLLGFDNTLCRIARDTMLRHDQVFAVSAATPRKFGHVMYTPLPRVAVPVSVPPAAGFSFRHRQSERKEQDLAQ